MTPGRWALLLPVLGVILVSAAAAQSSQEKATLTVFAAASLTDVFEEIAREMEKADPALAIRFNFAGSQQLAAQLAQGARADVFASADERWMRDAIDRGLVLNQPRIFTQNRLVVVIPAANPGQIERLQDLARPGLKVVLAADAVPAGRYSRQVLENLERSPGFPAGYRARVLRNLVSNEETVKAVLAKVQLGEADAGIVYQSDVTPSTRASVIALEIPDRDNIVAAYPIAVLRGAGEPEAARRFVTFVLSDAGQSILGRHGFRPLGDS